MLTIPVMPVDKKCQSGAPLYIMYLSYMFNYYRLGRFLFTLALLITFQLAGLAYGMPQFMYALGIYTLIVLLRLIITTEKINYFDFILDIVFISAIVYLSYGLYTYLTMLYLFPVFFSSVLIRTKRIFLFPLISIILYSAIYFINSAAIEKESILNISLHLLSFSLIAFAGDNLKERMENQARHIRRLEEEKIRMQGYERLYRVSADLAHELRNPLASVSAAVQFLKEGKNCADYVDMLETETKRITSLVNDFLLFSRPSDAQKEDVDIRELVETLCRRQDTAKTVSLNAKDNAIVVANATFMDVALNNIIKNAVEAARTTVKISLKRDEQQSSFAKAGDIYTNVFNDGIVAIDIEDDGPGVDDDLKDKIFEPFFTTKTTGTGLGLAIAYRIINSFGGHILVEKSGMGGVRFTVILPVKPLEKGLNRRH